MLPKLLEILNNKYVVLASGSPRRLEMLQKIGLNVKLVPSLFEENLKPSDFNSFSEFVEATALGKVNEVSERLTKTNESPYLIIGADTMVTLNDTLFGKPKDPEDAFKTLKTLSGKPHLVYTGVVLKMGPEIIKFTEKTKVFIGELNDEEIQAYIDTKEPLDKAGSYGIQGIGGIFVEKIEGDFFTVMGLPLYRLNKELTKLILNHSNFTLITSIFNHFSDYENMNFKRIKTEFKQRLILEISDKNNYDKSGEVLDKVEFSIKDVYFNEETKNYLRIYLQNYEEKM